MLAKASIIPFLIIIYYTIQELLRIMSKIHSQLATYTSSEGTRRQFMNFYRLVKTHSLLNSLFLADSITRDTYNSEVKETLDKIHLLKQQLERYDLKRFCELWGIETEFNNLGKMNEMMKSDMKVGIGVARVANMLPMISDETASASNYGQIHEPFSRFCIELTKMKESEKSITATFRKTIDDLLALETNFAKRYTRLSDTFGQDSRDELKEALTRFRVEYQKVYRF